MPTIVKTDSGTWKAVVRKTGFPTTTKTFRLKRDAEDWARTTEDEMVRGMYVKRGPAEKMLFAAAIDRYLAEVTPSKRPFTQAGEKHRAATLKKYFGKYSLAGITAELVAKYRDERLAGLDRLDADGNPKPRAANSVRLELALIGHLFTVAIKEWGLGLIYNPVLNIRRPSPGAGRNRRLSAKEEATLFALIDQYSNPMLRWIARIAIETGMRSSEIGTLKLDQVDLKKRVVLLKQTKNTTQRTVPLSKKATELFTEAVANPTRPKKETNLVFFGEPGKDEKRRPYNFNKAWREIKAKAGMPDLHFHDLRHEAVSRFVEAGLSDQEVSAISGHKSMQMLKRYTHLRAEDLVAKLDGLGKPRNQATEP
ncbi:site-specific integrase [Aquabacterium sp.]|uniref:site-specific integrase n=1 Tax=Aquabacterium sp. TaxID=1872578 RepID=UPI002487741C|nr:site-specific integrase [Aquabacterium sp.]MDI1350682.1 site-specific integrase [Aquabacterium sp.]